VDKEELLYDSRARKIVIKYIKQLSLLALIVLFPSCTNKLYVKEGEVDFLLVDYGKHSSLIIPNKEGGHIEFAFGEWKYFALDNTHWYRLPAILLWPTSSTLARGDYSDEAQLQRHLNRFITKVYPLRTSQSGLNHFLDHVLQIYASGQDLSYREDLEFTFVKLQDRPYSLFRNCNSVLISWLEILGIEHRGLVFSTNWEVERY
jgi:hypothetical protein